MAGPSTNTTIFYNTFWIVILLLIGLTVGLTITSSNRESPPAASVAPTATPAPVRPDYVIQSPVLANLFAEALTQTVSSLTDTTFLDAGLEQLYAPVYAAVSTYADYHYTVLGSYSEAFAGAFGDPAEKMEEVLFAGFDKRFAAFVTTIDSQFTASLESNFNAGLAQELPSDIDRTDVSSVTEALIDSTLERIQVSAPVSTAASYFGVVTVKKLTAQFVAALAAKTAAKTATKSGASVLGGAAAGATAGAFLGPVGSMVGGGLAAIGIWLGVDKLFVEGDELLNREEFEAELTAMIDASKAAAKQSLLAAIEQRATTIESSTLRDLSNQ